MPDDALSDEERRALINLLTVEIEASKFPLSPRIHALKRIRAKLRGEGPRPESAPQFKAKRLSRHRPRCYVAHALDHGRMMA